MKRCMYLLLLSTGLCVALACSPRLAVLGGDARRPVQRPPCGDAAALERYTLYMLYNPSDACAAARPRLVLNLVFTSFIVEREAGSAPGVAIGPPSCVLLITCYATSIYLLLRLQ